MHIDDLQGKLKAAAIMVVVVAAMVAYKIAFDKLRSSNEEHT